MEISLHPVGAALVAAHKLYKWIVQIHLVGAALVAAHKLYKWIVQIHLVGAALVAAHKLYKGTENCFSLSLFFVRLYTFKSASKSVYK